MTKVRLDIALCDVAEGVQVEGDVALFREGESIRATSAKCRHMGAQMRVSGKCRLTCPRHGWELNTRTLRYENPRGIAAPELAVERVGDRLRVYDADVSAPWGERGARRTLSRGQLTIRHYAHACMEVSAGGTRLFTDPWLQGPAFSRGWWLAQRPPRDWLERLAGADAIFISHNHSDHLNPPTLRALAERSRSVPIFVPAFETGSCIRELHALGFEDVRPSAFDTWITLGAMRLMILRDKTDRDDSALLVEHEGYRILDTVDCHHLDPLPEVDVLLAQHTTGASGFPVCWEELYGAAGVAGRVRKNLALAQQAMIDLVGRTRPEVFVPFAGYFVEAHPADAAIAASNRKNDPADVSAAVRRRHPDTQTWLPTPGAVFDLATRTERLATDAELVAPLDAAEMRRWIASIDEDEAFAPLQRIDGMQAYFDWAGFRGELLLHVIETDESFERGLGELFVRFDTGRVSSAKPDVGLPLLRMRVRRSVFRHVLRRGQSWDEIAIGFQARFFRDPDVYHFDFWDHFQHHLPREPLPWEVREIQAA